MTVDLYCDWKTGLQNRTSRKGGETKRGEVMREAGMSPPRLVYRGFLDVFDDVGLLRGDRVPRPQTF